MGDLMACPPCRWGLIKNTETLRWLVNILNCRLANHSAESATTLKPLFCVVVLEREFLQINLWFLTAGDCSRWVVINKKSPSGVFDMLVSCKASTTQLMSPLMILADSYNKTSYKRHWIRGKCRITSTPCTAWASSRCRYLADWVRSTR